MIPRYCDQCGSKLDDWAFDGRERKWCEDCERPVFRNAVPCAGVTVVDGERVLLVERTAEPGVGDWSIPAGHLEVEEEPREGASRELEEETGLTVDPAALTLLEATQLESPGEKHVVSVGYAARAADAAGTPEAGSDASAVEWVAVGELGERPLRPHVERRVAAALDALD
ncbi:NUDIX domain-containing protein [Halobacterium litoreum]|uniref:NUDIX domain-containing protein n=1 Tax=Halobacterium litoreum TaxID=2039234 RepID=A0ABD5NEI8_9EURY|nr:NUDIX domain-containing protein [Halobacterium litoreum]UHH13576.1 NUDIX domain-containing protein [Halobacterium litoreum]